jgi:N utilization substance protein A
VGLVPAFFEDKIMTVKKSSLLTARTEFAAALNQVCTERGIEPDVVLETIKSAVLAAYRKDFLAEPEELEGLEVEVAADTGEVTVRRNGEDITPPGFGRIAAQTAKQVILQRIREAEKLVIMQEFSERVGTLMSGMILRRDGPNWIVDLGRTQGVMPPAEQVAAEDYRLNQRLKVYIVGINEGVRGQQIIVSRAHKNVIVELFRQEVPEMQSGAVEVKRIAREAGERTKVAVYSSQPGVDPVGACVGQKGVRVQAVISELNSDERVDIIQWDPDTARFIVAALSPAKDLKIRLDEEKRTAQVTVADEELSLAIGKGGQNVRLAAKLTGFRIDIRGETQKLEKPEVAVATPADDFIRAGLRPLVADRLIKAGIADAGELRDKSDEELEEIDGIGPKTVEEIRQLFR